MAQQCSEISLMAPEAEKVCQEPRSPVLTIMFADTVASTEFAEQFGDLEAERRRKQQLETVRSIVEAKSAGRFLKSLGDGFMAAFAEPSLAVQRAIQIQRRLGANGLGPVRIGLHLGQVALDHVLSEDVYGRHVNRASRVCGLGKAGQILVTQPVYDNASGWLNQQTCPIVGWHRHGIYRLKGIQESVEVYEVLYEGHDTPRNPTHVQRSAPTRRPVVILPLDQLQKGFADYAHLVVAEPTKFRQAIVLDAPLITIGRGPTNQIIIKDIEVSRLHAVLAYIGQHWVIIDHSSRNGTYVNEMATRQHLLCSGDEIHIGPIRYFFRFEEESTRHCPYALYAMARSERARVSNAALPVMGEILDTMAEDSFSGAETCPSETKLTITCCGGPARGATHAFAGSDALVLGRGAAADLRLDDSELAERHLQLRPGDNMCLEMKTINDAPMPWVHGQQVPSALLRPGDMLTVGRCELVLHLPLHPDYPQPSSERPTELSLRPSPVAHCA